MKIVILLVCLLFMISLVSSVSYVCSCEDLQNIKNNLSGSYVLLQNLSCGSFNTLAGGANSAYYFTGSFDGQGYTIDGIIINSTALYQSVFGFVSGGVIKNVHFINLNVTMTAPSGDGYVGGVAGVLTGGSAIDNVSVSGIIYSSRNYVGSIAGYLANNGKSNITNCHSDADVYGPSVQYNFGAGGIAGGQNPTLGGNISYNYFNGRILNSTEINSTYSVNYGGIIGVGTGTGSNNYYDSETTGYNNVTGNAFGTNKTTLEMQNQGNYTNFDFVSVWRMGVYPYLNLPVVDFTVCSDDGSLLDSDVVVIPSMEEVWGIIRGGGSAGEVLRAWNPDVYPKLGVSFLVWLRVTELKPFFRDSGRVLLLFLQYVFRQPASLVDVGRLDVELV